MGYILGELGSDGAECLRKISSGCRYPVNARGMVPELTRGIHKTLLAALLLHSNETMLGVLIGR